MEKSNKYLNVANYENKIENDTSEESSDNRTYEKSLEKGLL